MSLIDHIAKGEREVTYIKTLEWIFELPNFILSTADKSCLASAIFQTCVNYEINTEVNFDDNYNHLLISTKAKKFFLAGLKNYISLQKMYSKLNKEVNTHIILVYDYEAPYNNKTDKTKLISYKEIVNTLDKLSIKDSKTQYLIEDLIDSLNNNFTNYIF